MPRAWAQPGRVRDMGVLAIAVALLYALIAGHPSFGSSIRYSEAAREMVETGDWILPRLYYVPYFEKPALTYWLGAAAQALFGDSWHAVHLPAGLAALVSVLCTWGLARLLRGGSFPLGAGLLLLGSGMFLVMATVLATDPILSAAMAAVWLCYARHDRAPASRWIWGFWLALGVGLMAKGPVAVALAGVGIAGFHLLADGPLGVLRALWRMRPLRGTLVLAAVNLPWWIAVWRQDPRLIEYFLVRFNLEAFYTTRVNHPEPAWFYLPVMLLAFVPWTLPVLGAVAAQVRGLAAPLAQAWRRRCAPALAPEDRTRLLLLAGVGFGLLFLSVSRSKLGTYPMPLFPLVAVLALDALYGAWGRGAAWPRRLWLVQGVAVVAVAVVALSLLPRWQARLGDLDWSWAWLVVAGAGCTLAAQAAAAVLGWRGRGRLALAVAGAGMAAGAALGVPVLDRAIPSLVSSPLAASARPLMAAEDLVLVYEPLVHDYHLLWGIRRRPHILCKPREVGMGHFVEMAPPPLPIPRDTYHLSGDYWGEIAPGVPPNPHLVPLVRFNQLWLSPGRMWFFADQLYLDIFRRTGLPFQVVGRARNVLLFTNHPLPVGALAGAGDFQPGLFPMPRTAP
ncbi:MAG: glycosyltransferase family 39 protein [Planctomycetes bacterium]|nr:glycosyltransferase family 39 protein [Planctomycetota bacterium]